MSSFSPKANNYEIQPEAVGLDINLKTHHGTRLGVEAVSEVVDPKAVFLGSKSENAQKAMPWCFALVE